MLSTRREETQELLLTSLFLPFFASDAGSSSRTHSSTLHEKKIRKHLEIPGISLFQLKIVEFDSTVPV